MKKFAYTQPEAEMVLLLEDDVIRTSFNSLADDVDDQGNSILPSVNWKF